MAFSDFLRFGVKVVEEMATQQQISQARQQFLVFLSLDRSAAMQHITSVVHNSSAEEMTTFELEFLALTSILVEPNSIVRAVELFGWLKDQQHEYYGHWRGFTDEQ